MDILSFALGMNAAKGSGGGSSGGGSLPAGAYCNSSPIRLPEYNVSQKWFYFKGELYATVEYVASTSPYNNAKIYKYNGTSWSLINTYSCEYQSLAAPYACLEYNGKMYFFTEYKYFSCWDGTTYTVDKTTFSNNITSAWVCNGKLYARTGKTCQTFSMDSTGTWTEETDFYSTKYNYYKPVVTWNDTAYFINSNKIYEISGGSLIECGDVPGYGELRTGYVDGNYLYYHSSSKGLCRYDFTAKETKQFSLLPLDTQYNFLRYNGEFLSIGTNRVVIYLVE